MGKAPGWRGSKIVSGELTCTRRGRRSAPRVQRFTHSVLAFVVVVVVVVLLARAIF
jgi:hypothetical protein